MNKTITNTMAKGSGKNSRARNERMRNTIRDNKHSINNKNHRVQQIIQCQNIKLNLFYLIISKTKSCFIKKYLFKNK